MRTTKRRLRCIINFCKKRRGIVFEKNFTPNTIINARKTLSFQNRHRRVVEYFLIKSKKFLTVAKVWAVKLKTFECNSSLDEESL